MTKIWLIYTVGKYGEEDSLITGCSSENDADIYIAIHKKHYPVLTYRKEPLDVMTTEDSINLAEEFDKNLN